MPSFATPGPITARLEPAVGLVTVIASDRTDTVVEVRPTDPANPSDVRAAEQTTVEFSGTTLTVKGPRRGALDFSTKTRSIDVTVELPTGSRVEGGTGVGDLNTAGRLAECRYKSGAGKLVLEHVAELNAHTGAGDIEVERIDGNAELTTSSGQVRLGVVAGGAVVKNSNGTTTIGSVGGPVRVRSANGDIVVEHADGPVEAKTANGAVRVLDAVRGALSLETAMGEIEIGIHQGSAAWLDVKTRFGRVRNEMAESTPPDEAVDKLEVHAATSFGDIVIRRS
jgi:hypothetical protein